MDLQYKEAGVVDGIPLVQNKTNVRLLCIDPNSMKFGVS
jgi:hypothetical protein